VAPAGGPREGPLIDKGQRVCVTFHHDLGHSDGNLESAAGYRHRAGPRRPEILPRACEALFIQAQAASGEGGICVFELDLDASSIHVEGNGLEQASVRLHVQTKRLQICTLPVGISGFEHEPTVAVDNAAEEESTELGMLHEVGSRLERVPEET